MSTNIVHATAQNNEEDSTDKHDLLNQYMKEIVHQPVLSIHEETALIRRIRAGDEDALDRLIRAHLLFVVRIAMEYRHKGLPILDLINEGNIGLITAAERFDETRGVRFISYAVWWIRQAIRQAFADQVRMIRLPRLQAEKLARIEEKLRSEEQATGQHVPVQKAMDESETGHHRLHRLLDVAARPYSLDEPNGGDSEANRIDALQDMQDVLPDEQIMTRQLKSYVHQAIHTLPQREAYVIGQYFGIEDAPKTLEEIGYQLGLSRERVRQLKDRGLQRLRHPSQSVRLHALL